MSEDLRKAFLAGAAWAENGYEGVSQNPETAEVAYERWAATSRAKSPLDFPCTDCGAEPRRACRPLEGDHPRSIGYHDARYAAAGWPLED